MVFFCDTTTTVSTLTPNKSIDITNNSLDLITTNSKKNELCVSNDQTKSDRLYPLRDTTTTISSLAPNKSIDIINNSRDTTTTDPTYPTIKSNNTTTTTTTTTVPKFQSPNKIITTTMVPITTTIVNPNDGTQLKSQRPERNYLLYQLIY